MSIKENIKIRLKNVRASQPFNRLATWGSKSLLQLTGLKSEFLIKHLHRIDSVESKLPNEKILRLYSKGDDWVSNQVFWRGWHGYEPETVPFFFRLAERSKCTLDIGAYVGFFALLAGHANPDSKVFAFEPLPTIYGRLVKHIELNQLTNVEAILGAVGKESGETEFYHQAGNDIPTSSSLSYEFMKDAGNLISTKVKVFQLDKFIEERKLERIDLMKIDTESTEPDVLRGAAGLLAKNSPNIICEVLLNRGSEKPLEEILRPLGYQFYLLTPDGPIEKQNIEGHPEYLNYFFTKLKLTEITNLLEK